MTYCLRVHAFTFDHLRGRTHSHSAPQILSTGSVVAFQPRIQLTGSFARLLPRSIYLSMYPSIYLPIYLPPSRQLTGSFARIQLRGSFARLLPRSDPTWKHGGLVTAICGAPPFLLPSYSTLYLSIPLLFYSSLYLSVCLSIYLCTCWNM